MYQLTDQDLGNLVKKIIGRPTSLFAADMERNRKLLDTELRELRLPSIAQGWRRAATDAARRGTPYAEYLADLVHQEITDRHDRRVSRRIKEAHFPSVKTIDAFDFDRQPVRVPTGLAFAIKPLHRFIAWEQVLDRAGQAVTGMRFAVGGRGAFVENILRSAGALVERLLIDRLRFPEREHVFFERREGDVAGRRGEGLVVGGRRHEALWVESDRRRRAGAADGWQAGSLRYGLR